MMITTHFMAGAAAIRRFSTDIPAEEMFMEAWKRVAPDITPPKLPLSFMQPRPPVDMVTVPALTGQMGILPGHVATMTELKPGLLSLRKGDETTKYFVSGGFVFVHPNSIADIIAIEAVPVNRIDPLLIQTGLAEFSQKLSSANTAYDKAEAQIGLDVHSALNSALAG